MELKGIDVSHWQGHIDWQAVKDSGICFAILKAGGSDDGFYTDRNFEENYQGAKSVGINVGAYYFVGPDFKSSEDGLADAERFLKIVEGKEFEYPLFVDIESTDPSDEEGVTDAAIAFLDVLQNKGYLAGIYGSDISTYDDRLVAERLIKYSKWVAKYSDNPPSYVKDYEIWQYSSSGHVAGIKGNVDMNICYVDYQKSIPENSCPENPKKEAHNIGEQVRFKSIYASSESKEALKPLYTEGKITSIKEGARNPYLINDGMGWIGDRDITDTPVYVVKPGDTLWDIAANQLGNGLRYTEIAELNGLNDADYIYQGQELKLPIN